MNELSSMATGYSDKISRVNKMARTTITTPE